MPDNDGTLRDILQGFNTMQARLGLTPGSSAAQGIQPINTPPIKHPGQFSQEASIQIQQSTQRTAQQIQQIQMLQQPNAMAFLPPGGVGGGTPAGGQFARQYQQRMGQIQSGYQDPFQAQQMAQQLGQPGFMTLPSPTFMTPPSMGVFRPGFQAPPPIAMARTPPMIQTPFTPQLPAPMFQTPAQMEQAQTQLTANENFSGMMAGIPTAARLAMGGGGVGLGIRLGGRFGTAGRIAGGIAGGLLGFGPGGALAESGAQAALNPAIERRAFGMQMQNISRNFVVSGPELAEGGRGLNMQAGIQTANMMRRAVDKDQTAGFNMRDMMGITSMAGDMGMMDMAQNSEQIVNQAKNVAKGLSAFMRLANEPDVRRAMQQMSMMRSMGLTVPETTASMQNAQQFARMAGTSVAALGQSAGMPGAMTFQQMGMTAGLGYNVGMGAGGMARQAVSAGAFTPGQLAMAGGVRGVQQQLTEAAGAGLGVNFPMMAMLSRNEQGKLTIDPEKARRIASGQVSLTQQAGMAQQNVEQLGGAKVITELSTRLNELRDQLGRTLGPQGSLLYTLQQGMAMQKELGGPSVMGIGGALRALGLNPQQARTMEVMAQSPQFWRNMQQQMQGQIDDARREEAANRERRREMSTLTSQMGRSAVVRGAARLGERIGETVSGAYDDVSQWFSDRNARERAAGRGQTFVRLDDRLRVQNERQQREINRFIGSGEFARQAERSQAEMTRGGALRGVREMTDVAGDFFGNLASGGITGMLGLTGEAGRGTAGVRARIAVGGLGGAIAEAMPNFASLVLTAAGRNDHFIQQAKSVARAAQQLQQGTALSKGDALRLQREANRDYKEIQRAYGDSGGKDKSFGGLQDSIVRGIVGKLEDRSSWLGDKAMSSEEMRQEAIRTATSRGMSPAAAEKFFSKDRWEKQGLGAMTMRRVKREATDDAQGSLATTEQARGFQGALAGKDLQAVVENLGQMEEQTKEAMGFYKGLDATNESYKRVVGMMTTSSADEMLAMQALALRTSGSDKDKDKGDSILQKLRARRGDEKANALVEKMGQRLQGTDNDTKDMLRRVGTSLADKSGKEQLKTVQDYQARLKFTRGAQQMAAGAARIAEDVDSLNAMARGGFTDQSTIAAMQGVLGSRTEQEALRKASPEAAAALEQFQAAGDDEKKRAQAVRRFQLAMAKRGATERGEVFLGGKGAGGAREGALKEQLGTAERMAAQLTGDPQGDFAKTIPLFAKATAQLNETGKRLNNAIDQFSLLAKLRS